MSLQSNYLKDSTENQVNQFKHIRHIRQATVCFEKQSFLVLNYITLNHHQTQQKTT